MNLVREYITNKNPHNARESLSMLKKRTSLGREASFSYSLSIAKITGQHKKEIIQIVAYFENDASIEVAEGLQVAGRKSGNFFCPKSKPHNVPRIPLLDIGIHNGIYRGQNYGR